MGSPVWALAGVGQDSAGKVARGSSLESWFFIIAAKRSIFGVGWQPHLSVV